jgi:predicted metal-binding membrane protein
VRWHHPEWWLGVLAAAAWVVLLVAGPAIRRSGGMGAGWMPVAPVSGIAHAATEIALWVLMTVAMMLPTILPTARHLGLTSYWERRQRAIAWYAAGYVAVWVVVGLGLIGSIHLLEQIVGPAVTAILTFGAAIAWQRSPRKLVALQACGSAAPVPSSGRRADLGCLGLGAETGMSCVASCWALMWATLAASHSLSSMIVVAGVLLWERRADTPRPPRAIPVIAGLGVATLLALELGARLP